MTTTNYAERVGLEEQMLEYLKQHRAELEARGLNVAYWIARLEAATAAVKAANDRQEALKAELKASTVSVNAADHEAYVVASGMVDATVAVWGKDSPQAEIVARMRSKVNRPAATSEAPAILPVPKPSS